LTAATAEPHFFNDLFVAFGPISMRRMSGGAGIYAGGGIGIVMRGQIYFKTGDPTRQAKPKPKKKSAPKKKK
jgi:TfoX/Sxy family transcriptional regulator of competence genes